MNDPFLAVLSGSEENSALSSAIAQLSTVQEKLEEVHYEQATADFYFLSELIKDYIGLVGAVKDVFAVSIIFPLIFLVFSGL